jgi:hypothetical protein
MLWDPVIVIFLLLPVLAIYLIYQNYQLEKKWRCMRYCWHVMSDFAGESTREEDGSWDFEWEEIVNEHRKFMKRFGIDMLSNQQLELYETALLERNIGILTEHRTHTSNR